MAKEYSNYQKDVISRYYNNIDGISLQKLQELLTELFLAHNTPKEDKLWERVEKAMIKLKVPAKLMEHIMTKRDVQILARNVEQWLKKAPK